MRFDILLSYMVGQLARFCASAGSSHFAALHLMEYDLSISRSTQSSSWITTKVRRRPQVSTVIAMRTGERATAVERSLVTSSGTTELQSHGNPSFRSRWRSQLLRLSTTQHRLARWRSSICVNCYAIWASDPHLRRQFMRTTRHALSGIQCDRWLRACKAYRHS